jgi:hypothetical protein
MALEFLKETNTLSATNRKITAKAEYLSPPRTNRKIEQEFGQIRKYLADLEILTFQHGKINPHAFCIDELDHKIMEYLLHYKSATTPELAEYVKTNRWLVLNRLRKIEKSSKKQTGKSIIEYYAGERSGKKKAWWIDQELIQE